MWRESRTLGFEYFPAKNDTDGVEAPREVLQMIAPFSYVIHPVSTRMFTNWA